MEYEDAIGHGRAEPEAFVDLGQYVVVAEAKLTGSQYGHAQLAGLYVPLLAHIFRKPVLAIQVCKAVYPETPGPFLTDPTHILTANVPVATWHWPGR